MKSLFLLLLFWCSMVHAHSIVFIHIGPEIPPHVFVAMKQARLFNPTCPIFLVANLNARIPATEFYNHFTFISCESLQASRSHKQFLARSTLDRDSLKGFWVFTSERFFYLEELIRQYNLTDVFHLENDVMLYTDLESLLPIFRDKYCGKIGATFDSDTRCIPGFVYIPGHKPISELISLMARRASAGKNDMEMLHEFRAAFLYTYIEHLPIIPPEYGRTYPLKNKMGASTDHPEWYSENFTDFQSIFDAAAIGQYLGGTFPGDGSGPPGYINETSLFNPSLLRYEWRIDDQGRGVPFILFQGAAYRINNLHIHCKHLGLFCSEN